ERCTVLLCTHNLGEAERICHRVSIVQYGRAVAEGTPAELKAGMAKSVQLVVRTTPADLVGIVAGIRGVIRPRLANCVIVYETTDARRVNPQVVRSVVEAGGEVVSLNVETVALEDAYLQLMQIAADQE